jgi:hypothetical protein
VLLCSVVRGLGFESESIWKGPDVTTDAITVRLRFVYRLDTSPTCKVRHGSGKERKYGRRKNWNLGLCDEKTQVTRTGCSMNGLYTTMGTGFFLLRMRIESRLRSLCCASFYHMIQQTMRGWFSRCLHWLCSQRPVSPDVVLKLRLLPVIGE